MAGILDATAALLRDPHLGSDLLHTAPFCAVRPLARAFVPGGRLTRREGPTA